MGLDLDMNDNFMNDKGGSVSSSDDDEAEKFVQQTINNFKNRD